MAHSPASSVKVRTRGGLERTWVMPMKGTPQYDQFLYALEVGDIAVLEGDELASAGEPGDEDLEALRAEYEEVVGKRPHPNAKPGTLRERIDEVRQAATADDADSDDLDDEDLDEDLDDDG